LRQQNLIKVKIYVPLSCEKLTCLSACKISHPIPLFYTLAINYLETVGEQFQLGCKFFGVIQWMQTLEATQTNLTNLQYRNTSKITDNP